MMENAHYVLGFFIPILVAGGAGYLLGRFHSQIKINVRDVVVFALIPEYNQVKVKAKDGFQYTINEKTMGNHHLDQLKVGDLLRVTLLPSSVVIFVQTL